MCGSGKSSFGQALLRSRKSMQRQTCPFFLLHRWLINWFFHWVAATGGFRNWLGCAAACDRWNWNYLSCPYLPLPPLAKQRRHPHLRFTRYLTFSNPALYHVRRAYSSSSKGIWLLLIGGRLTQSLLDGDGLSYEALRLLAINLLKYYLSCIVEAPTCYRSIH